MNDEEDIVVLAQDERAPDHDHLQYNYPTRNPRIVGPDDFQWWLMLEQTEQM